MPDGTETPNGDVKVKPGYKTTEFWVFLVTSLGTALNQSGILGTLMLPIEAIASVVGIAATYIIGRAWTKAGAAKNGTSIT